MKDKIRNTIYGAIVADALGVPVEFKDRALLRKKPVTDMIGYGTYNLPKGSWSDDSSMTLCLAESIGRLKGIDYDDIMKNFYGWYKHSKFTPDHHVFDIGRTCHTAIMNSRQGCEGTEKDELLKNALPKIGEYVRHNPHYASALSKYERITHKSFTELSEDKIKSSGYVVDTLEAALWCFLTTNNYHDCVLKAVNLGSDTDTVACVAGSIAGLYYGEIPADWIEAIRNKKLVNKVIEKFSCVVLGGEK